MAFGWTDIAFDTGVGTQTLNYELGKLDLADADWIELTLKVTKTDTDAADTCNIYLQSRGRSGIWTDRISSVQFTGDQSASAGSPEVWKYTLQQAGTLSDAEEGGESSGSAGGSRLTAGTVKNGAFPGKYYTGGALAASWRIQVVIADADNDADFEGTAYIGWNSVI